MRAEIKNRIEQIRQGKVPAGYKKTKQGISPAEWTGMSVKDCLCRVEKPVQVEPETLYTQIGIRSHGNGIFYKEPVTGRELKNKSVFWIEPDCFILNIVFAWEQAVGRTTKAEKGMIGSHRFPMYRPIEDRVDIDYLVYYFLTPRGTNILEEASPGGAGRNRTLGQERFLKSTILLPPIEEQQEIAKILMTQDRVIALREKLLAEKLRQKQYLMQVLLTGKKRLPGFSEKWKLVHLKDLCAYVRRRSVNSFDTYVNNENISSNLKGTVHFGEERNEVAGMEYRKGDILIGNIRPYLKKIWLADRDGICSPDILVLRPSNISSSCMYNLIATDTFFSYMMTGAGGSKMPRGDKKQVMEYPLQVPQSVKEQDEISHIFSLINEEIELLEQVLIQERWKKKALMQLLLSGIVRVKP